MGKITQYVIPAPAGIHSEIGAFFVDSRLCGNDSLSPVFTRAGPVKTGRQGKSAIIKKSHVFL